MAESRWLAAVRFSAMLALAAGCGAPAVAPEEEMPLQEQVFRRFSGSSSAIYSASKKALDRLGVQVTGEREGAIICGKLDIARKPVFVSVKLASANRVYVRFYNLTATEEEEWRTKVYREIDAVLGTTPAERERAGRAKRG